MNIINHFFHYCYIFREGRKRKWLGRIVEGKLDLKILGEELRPIREREEVGKLILIS